MLVLAVAGIPAAEQTGTTDLFPCQASVTLLLIRACKYFQKADSWVACRSSKSKILSVTTATLA